MTEKPKRQHKPSEYVIQEIRLADCEDMWIDAFLDPHEARSL